jgi:hypothetical protein
MDINALNVERAATRRIFGDGNIVVVAEIPVASLRPGDINDLVSMTLSFARLDAPLLAAVHGGRSVTDPPEALAPDVHRQLDSWRDVLRASKTAAERADYPFCLKLLKENLEELQEQAEDGADEDD